MSGIGSTRRRVAMAVTIAAIGVGAVGTADAADSTGAAGAIGNRAFLDSNANGRWDAGEPGLAGIRVTVSNLAGTPLVTGFTAGGGWWGIRNLPTTQCYKLAYTIPSEYLATAIPAPNTPNASTIGPDGTVPTTICPTAAPQDQWDAGFVPQPSGGPGGTGRVGNRAWTDTDGDGMQDADEPGLVGLRVHLARADGSWFLTGLTGEGGYWGFGNLPTDRCFRLRYEPPASTRPSPTAVNGVATQSTIGADNEVPGLICPTSEPQNQWDAGFVPFDTNGVGPGYLGDRVLLDNGNGVVDAADTGLADVPVRLIDPIGRALRSGVTGPGGWYGFRDLRTDRCYRVEITVPAGTQLLGDRVDANGRWSDALCPKPAAPTIATVDFLLRRA